MKKIFVFQLLLLFACSLQAQRLTGIATRYSDSFVEWLYYAEDDEEEEEEGELKLRWLNQGDWTDWDYRIGEAFGNIKLKWRDNPDEWELRGDNKIVTARTVWNGDFREWRVTDNTRKFTFKTKWGNQSDEWELRDSKYGAFRMYTSWEKDPREWVIEDELGSEISLPMKIMLMFVAVFHSSPKQ